MVPVGINPEKASLFLVQAIKGGFRHDFRKSPSSKGTYGSCSYELQGKLNIVIILRLSIYLIPIQPRIHDGVSPAYEAYARELDEQYSRPQVHIQGPDGTWQSVPDASQPAGEKYSPSFGLFHSGARIGAWAV